jgi:hypothetical protein
MLILLSVQVKKSLAIKLGVKWLVYYLINETDLDMKVAELKFSVNRSYWTNICYFRCSQTELK